MSNLGEKVSYIKGLAEGMKIDTESGEGKLIVQMIDVLNEAAKQISELQEAYEELNDYVECIDDDLEALELKFDGEDEEDDDEDFEFSDDLDDSDDDESEFEFEDEDEDEPLDEIVPEEGEDFSMYVGCICPECNGMFCIDAGESDDDTLFVCPHCGKKVVGIPMDSENVPVAKSIEGEDGEEDKDE